MQAFRAQKDKNANSIQGLEISCKLLSSMLEIPKVVVNARRHEETKRVRKEDQQRHQDKTDPAF
jgi:hypothetical protein